MQDLEKKINEQANALMMQENSEGVDTLLEKKAREASDVKTAIDLLATKTALKQEETLNKVVEEKQEELRNDAEAKRVQAETERISKEVEKVRQEKEKELVELDRTISLKRAEVDHLKAESDIAQAYFNSNKDILKCIGIREKKSLGVMKALMIPASFIFIIAQILFSPISFCGILLEIFVDVIGSVCGAIKNNAIKIISAVLIALVIIAVGVGVYYVIGEYIFNSNGG